MIYALILAALLSFNAVPASAPGTVTVDAGAEQYLPEVENDSTYAVIDDIEPLLSYSYATSKDGVEVFAEKLKASGKVKADSVDNIEDRSYRLNFPEFDIFLYDVDSAESAYPHYRAYLMYENEIYEIASPGWGGGPTGFAVADVNGDGVNELYCSYTWHGSGVPGYHILGCFDPAGRNFYGIYNRPISFDGHSVIPYTDENGDLKVYVGYGYFKDGELTTTAYSEYGEVVYTDGEFVLNVY